MLKKMKEKEKEMRLLILGLDNAGKTTIVKKFNGEDTTKISPKYDKFTQTIQEKQHMEVRKMPQQMQEYNK